MASVIPCAYSQHLYHCLFQEAQLNEVLSASNLDPSALTMVTRKLEVSMQDTWHVFLLNSDGIQCHTSFHRMCSIPRTVQSEISSMNWPECARYIGPWPLTKALQSQFSMLGNQLGYRAFLSCKFLGLFCILCRHIMT